MLKILQIPASRGCYVLSKKLATEKLVSQFKQYQNKCYSCQVLNVEKKRKESVSGQMVRDFYAKKSVFITGGTGYLGKVMIEKILSSCKEIDNVYILIREKKDMSPEKRKEKLIEDALFARLKEENPRMLKKIIHINGDLLKPGLGITENDRNTLIENVSVVFHMAATVKFDEPLETALKINVEGTQGVLDLCDRMKKLDAFVHVSTAYSNTDKAIVEERVYPPPASLSEVYTFVKEHGGNELEEAKFISSYNLESNKLMAFMCLLLDGRPNTYTYTKALAEHEVLVNHGDIPSVIVRPSAITPILKEPIVGWLDNWYGSTALFFGVFKGIIHVMQTNKTNVLDLIPVDMVVNLTLVAATRCQMSKDLMVYNCCSGLQNTFTIGLLLSRATELAVEHNLSMGPYPFIVTTESSIMKFLIRLFAETLPAHHKDIWLQITGKQPKHVTELRQFQKVVDSLTYFTTHDWVFHDDNVRELISTMSPEDQKIFYCDPAEIQWESYLADYIFGIHKYLLKTPLMNKKTYL